MYAHKWLLQFVQDCSNFFYMLVEMMVEIVAASVKPAEVLVQTGKLEEQQLFGKKEKPMSPSVHLF